MKDLWVKVCHTWTTYEDHKTFVLPLPNGCLVRTEDCNELKETHKFQTALAFVPHVTLKDFLNDVDEE